ncbi:hypothetical protein [Kitasatospora sp. NPDC094016]|uniref:hypothetical protein n=1 Tax=Kitasatospora sp. NPDC094016 TaxID=3154986 RepID=UPI003317F568
MTSALDQAVQQRELAAFLKNLDQRLTNIERAAQLPYSAARGQLQVIDDDGRVISTVGRQTDGTVGVTVAVSPPPPTPLAPLVEAAKAALKVTWDGQWADAYTAPLNLSHLEVHAGSTPDFTLEPQSIVATLAAAGASITLATTTYSSRWLRLVAVNAAGARGPASAATQGTPLKVVTDDLINGIIGELQLANSAVTAAKVATGAINSDALQASAVTTTKIAVDAVSAGKIAAEAVTAREIKALSVSADKLAANSVTAGKIAAGSVTAASLSADAIDGRTIRGVTITGGTVTGGTLQTSETGRRVLLSPADPVEGRAAPSMLLYSGATAEQQPARLTAEVRTTPDGAVPMTRLTGPQLTADGNHTPRLWLNSGAPGTGYPARGSWALGVAGEYGMAGEAVISGAAGDTTNAASIQMSVRRSTSGYKTALTQLNPETWFTQLADQVAAMDLSKDGLTVRALLGEVLLQTGTGLRLQGGNVDVGSGLVKNDSKWAPITLKQGCTQLSGWQTIGVKQLPDGMVALRGIVSVPAGVTSGVIGTIDDPALRPKAGETFRAITPNNTGGNLFAQPNGNLELWNGNGALGGWLSLSGVQWSSID